MNERKERTEMVDREDLAEILAKTKKQTSVSTTGPMARVLRRALNVFEDATSAGEAYRRALANWDHNQRADSKRGALGRLEENVATLLELNRQLLAEVQALRQENVELRSKLPGDGLQ